jgi:hypothetical protein
MYSIFLGVQDITNFSDGLAAAYSVSRVKANENYDSFSVSNDIAIIKINCQVSLNIAVQPACLPDPKQSGYPTSVNISAYVNGWGDLYDNSTFPDVLQNVELTIYDPNTCSNVYPELQKNWKNQICAGKMF